MQCPRCQSMSDRVVDSRAAREGRAIRRRRECLECECRFTTYESLEERPLQVLKRDGSAEEFEREKVRAGIATACAKRPVSSRQMEALVDRVEDAAAESAATSESAGVEVRSSEIGRLVMEGLKPLDRVAYIRYASVYRNFQDIDEFQEMVDELNVRERTDLHTRFQAELPLP